MADFFTDWCQIYFRGSLTVRCGASHPVALLPSGGLSNIFDTCLDFELVVLKGGAWIV
jgi:hypothetical protein